MLDTMLDIGGPGSLERVDRRPLGSLSIRGQDCLAAIAEFDSVDTARAVAAAMVELHPSTEMVAGEARFTFSTCAPA